MFVWLFLVCLVSLVQGHGRLRDPPSRSSMWRDGFKAPTNYDDNQLFCGGFSYQYSAKVRGRCGVCGDRWGAAMRENEAGGRYAKGIITRTYDQGQTVRVRVEITAHHGGWFEFRLCPNNDVTRPVTHECLNRHVLQLADGSGTRYKLTLGGKAGNYFVNVRLPSDVYCEQCVLQWRYHAGNNWGRDPDGRACVGCGDQEEFYGCADVSILTSGIQKSPTTPVRMKKTTPSEVITMKPALQPTTTAVYKKPRRPKPKNRKPKNRRCRPVGVWRGIPGMRRWCRRNCKRGHCPPTYCRC